MEWEHCLLGCKQSIIIAASSRDKEEPCDMSQSSLGFLLVY